MAHIYEPETTMIKLWPEPDDIVIRASATIQDIQDSLTEETEVIDGKKLGEVWPGLVQSTHVNYGDPYRMIGKSVFMPIDFDRFLAIRTRACSSLEKWGPNSNGDGFPHEDLLKSHLTLIGKGFYIEHASFDPRNAIGINAHSQYLDKDQYVVAVSLVDKKMFPEEAKMIRKSLNGKTAGVSIGCIAGTAECSVCHNLAQKKHEICAHMDRGNPFCVKGRRANNGGLAFDICRNLVFYELSYTKSPADRDARPHIVMGADENKKEPVSGPRSLTLPSKEELEKMVGDKVDDVWKGILNKLIKGDIDRQLSNQLRSLQVELRPAIREIVKRIQITK